MKKVTVSITATPKTIERVNALLAYAIRSVEGEAELETYFGLKNKIEMDQVKAFRKDMIDSFIAQ